MSAPANYTWDGVFESFAEAAAESQVFEGQRWLDKSLAYAKTALAQSRSSGGAVSSVAVTTDYGLPFLAAVAARRHAVLRVLDFGGRWERVRCRSERCSPATSELEFVVVENAAITDAGSTLFADDSGVRFRTDLPAPSERFDIVHFGSSLQYVDDWKGLLASVSALEPEYLVFADLTAADNRSFVTVQRYDDRRIPVRFWNVDEFIAAVSALGFELLLKARYRATTSRATPSCPPATSTSSPPQLHVSARLPARSRRHATQRGIAVFIREDLEKSKRETAAVAAKDKGLRKMSLEFIVESDKHGYGYQWSWLGLPFIQMPQDMVATQEIIWETKPDLIIETGVAWGGSVVFYASLLQLLGKGEVVGIDLNLYDHVAKQVMSYPFSESDPPLQGLVHRSRGLREGALPPEAGAVGHGPARLEPQPPARARRAAHLRSEGHEGAVPRGVGHDREDIPKQEHRPRPWGPGDNPKTALHAYLKETDRFEVDPYINAQAAPDLLARGLLPMREVNEIFMAGPSITEHEEKIVLDAIRNGWYGKQAYHYVETFEAEFAKYHDRKFALMTPNCTTSLHLLLGGLGIGEGDEVIAPDCTWVGSVACITYQRAVHRLRRHRPDPLVPHAGEHRAIDHASNQGGDRR